MNSLKILTCFTAATSPSQWVWPKLHTALNLLVQLSSGGNPRGWEEGHGWFGLLWSRPSFSYHPQGLHLLHTPGVMVPMKIVWKWWSPDNSNASTTLNSHGHTRCSDVFLEHGIQRDTEPRDLHYATRCHCYFYGQNSTEDTIKTRVDTRKWH